MNMGGMIRQYIAFMAFFFLVGLLNGCVNLEAVSKFADGTQALSEASGKFYEMELQTDRHLAAMTVDLGGPENSPDCPGMTPWDCATKGKNLMSEARRNRAAISSLAEYARGLHEIAAFKDDENIEKASQELSGNLGNIGKTLGNTADPKDQVLASAISSLAKVYLDLKVRKIIYEKVKLAHPHVKKITDTLRNDIKRQQQRFALERVTAKATREEWFSGFRAGYQASGVSASKKAFLSLAAGQLVENELRDELAVQPSALFLEKFETTVESCVNAHQAIQTPDLSAKSGTIVKFVGDARSLISTLNQMPN
jgi:hypothetical protein